jgi:hypothetical protein
MNNFLCILLAALAAALILGSCIRQDMRTSQILPNAPEIALISVA